MTSFLELPIFSCGLFFLTEELYLFQSINGSVLVYPQKKSPTTFGRLTKHFNNSLFLVLYF